jgi:hypothetical protein
MPDPMGFSAFPQRGDTHRIQPHETSASIGGRASIPKDKRTLGQTNTLLERGVDFEGLRRDRLHKVQTEMQSRDIGALLLTDTINIRYATGVSVMPLWSATNLAH